MNQNQLMQITVTFNFALFQTQEIQCNLSDILETVIIKYTSIISKDPKSLLFQYNSTQLKNDDFKKTLNQIIIDKEQKKMNIRVVQKENDSKNKATIPSNKIIKNNNTNNNTNNNSTNNNANNIYNTNNIYNYNNFCNETNNNLITNNNTLMINNPNNNINTNNISMMANHYFPQVSPIPSYGGTTTFKCAFIKNNRTYIIVIAIIILLATIGGPLIPKLKKRMRILLRMIPQKIMMVLMIQQNQEKNRVIQLKI